MFIHEPMENPFIASIINNFRKIIQTLNNNIRLPVIHYCDIYLRNFMCIFFYVGGSVSLWLCVGP
jgi:hypothetical protein